MCSLQLSSYKTQMAFHTTIWKFENTDTNEHNVKFTYKEIREICQQNDDLFLFRQTGGEESKQLHVYNVKHKNIFKIKCVNHTSMWMN